MTGTCLARIAATLILTASLAACGSKTNDFRDTLSSVRSNLALNRSSEAPAGIDANGVSTALAATPRSLSLMQSEDPPQQFIMVNIERNGAYRTYATSTREAVILRGGMITSTRGLGGDLMSSDEDQLYSLVSSRLDGTANYTLRQLTPEDLTVSTDYRCNVTRGTRTAVQIGELNTSGVVIKADCSSSDGGIVNTFLVDDNGQILSSRQFISAYYGYLTTQVLRR